MFFNTHPKPSKLKRIIYLIAATILGLLLSFFAHALIEINCIKHALVQGKVLANHMVFGSGYCVLPVYLQLGLFILGIAGGFLLGRFWWRIIYVDRIWEKKYKK